MPNYNISECVTNNIYVVSAGTLTIGQIIGFYFGEAVLCGEVIEITTNEYTGTWNYNYTDCCECISATTDSVNFEFIGCEDLITYNIEGTNFCNTFGIPSTEMSYEIQFGSNPSFCAKFIGLASSGETNYSYVSGPFSDCDICIDETIIISAGTEYKVCVFCCPCGATGGTVNNVSVPHPTWTGLNGSSIILLDAVVLGGINGLNN